MQDRPITMSLILLCFLTMSGNAWEIEEHRLLGDSVYYSVLRQWADFQEDSSFADSSVIFSHKLWEDKTFGQLCADFAEDDFSFNRFHDYGKTVLEQLRPVSADNINEALNKVTDRSTFPPILSAENVISTYLLYHLTALHMAQKAAAEIENSSALNEALVVEAKAQGYLADAFSAGHILTPVSDFLAFMHPRNAKESHHYHRNNSVYVINSRGDVWQTFGDKIMHWYVPCYQAVFEVCQSSLKELLFVFYQSSGHEIPDSLEDWLDEAAPGIAHDVQVSNWLSISEGIKYYADFKMPTLMLLPMPVSASWSYRTEKANIHGIRRHHHYPQLIETGLHDPDLTEIDIYFLYSRQSVPDWMVPEPLVSGSVRAAYSLIKSNPDWASVRWVQNRYAPPSFKGLLLHVGGQVMSKNGREENGGLFGLGYGFWDNLILVRNVSVNLTIMPSVYETNRLLLVPSGDGGINLQLFDCLRALHFDAGYAIGLKSEYKQHGFTWAVGLDSEPIPLLFTNAAITIRLKYQIYYLEENLRGASMEFILH